MQVVYPRFAAWALALVALPLIDACSNNAGNSYVPAQAASVQRTSHAMDTTASPTASPGTNSSALPGTNSSALPGTNSSALPGATLACVSAWQAGMTNCTAAINSNIAVNPNAGASPSQIFGYQPNDLRSAYGVPSTTAGGTVAIVDAYDDPNAEGELGTYRAAFGLPACTSANGCFTKVNETGATGAYPAIDTGWDTEIAIDVEMVSAICPNCKIILVETNSASLDDLGAGVDVAVRLGARAVSNSYYTPEYATEAQEDVHYNHPGVAITASSGDQQYPSFPAASTHVLSVGGTSLTNAGGAWSQTPWQFDGHGCSQYIDHPNFQPPGQTGCPTRAAVDVSVVADPQTGVAVFSLAQGGWVVAGGTSVGAPLVAAMYAVNGSGSGPQYAYQNAQAFQPIGVASGYDSYTGLGSPRGVGGL